MLPPDRRPERERQRHRTHERQGVPVVQRLAQPGDPLTVRDEVRDHLAGERPQERRSEQPEQRKRHHPHRTWRGSGDQHAQHREREINDSAVEVLPRAVGLHRPHDREPVPEDEPAEERQERDPEPVQPRKRHNIEEHERDPDGGGQHRQPADPDERRISRAVAEEERQRRDHGRCADQQGPGGTWEAPWHWPRS